MTAYEKWIQEQRDKIAAAGGNPDEFDPLHPDRKIEPRKPRDTNGDTPNATFYADPRTGKTYALITVDGKSIDEYKKIYPDADVSTDRATQTMKQQFGVDEVVTSLDEIRGFKKIGANEIRNYTKDRNYSKPERNNTLMQEPMDTGTPTEKGEKSTSEKRIQAQLNNLIGAGLEEDGIIGPLTMAALKKAGINYKTDSNLYDIEIQLEDMERAKASKLNFGGM